jgi:hypothetical protein
VVPRTGRSPDRPRREAGFSSKRSAVQALVTGATGYVGSRLAPALLGDWAARVLTRGLDVLDAGSGAPAVTSAAG